MVSLLDKITFLAEVDEVCVGSPTLPYADYARARVFDLTCSVVYNQYAFGKTIEVLRRRQVDMGQP